MPALLIVAASRDDRSTLHDLLVRSRLGHAIAEAATQEQALAVCRASRPDAILIVDRPPDQDGIEQLDALGDLPIIIIAAAEDEGRALAALDRGAQDYLVLGEITPLRLRLSVHRATHAAPRANAWLDALITSTPTGIAYLDSDLRYQLVNPAIAAINGIPLDAHIGRTLSEVLPRLNPRIEPMLRQVLKTGVAAPDLELHREPSPHDGVARDWLLSAFPVAGAAGEVSGVGITVTEITPIKSVEAALREAEAKLSAIFTILPAGISVINAKGIIIYSNPAQDRIARQEHDVTAPQAGAVAALRYLRPDGTPRPREEFATVRAYRSHQAVDAVETGIVSESGETIWVSASAVPVDFRDWRVVTVMVDISARKQAEDALRASEARYRILFETMAQGIVYHQADGQIIAANAAAERILGVSLSQLQGRTSLDPRWHSIREDGTPFPGEMHPAMVALHTGQEVSRVVMGVFNPADGTYRWISIHAVPQFQAGQTSPSHAYTMFDDITMQRQFQRALEQERQQLAAIVRTMHEAVVACRPDGAVALINTAALEMRDLDIEQPPATLHSMLKVSPQQLFDLHGHLLAPDAWPMPRVLHGERFEGLELRVQSTRDGRERWQRFNGTPVYDDQGALIVGVITARDITLYKQHEAALLAQTEQLSRVNAELTRALRLKDEFLTMMSHELRTPLNIVLGYAESLVEEIYGPLNLRQRAALAVVSQSGRHLLAMLSDILDLAYLEAGETTIKPVTINIDALCRSALRFVEETARQKGLHLLYRVEPGVDGLRADERRMMQILINLLSNAVKFTPESGSVGLEVAAEQAQERIQITVWDTGIGISDADYSILFQPFTQVDSQLSRRYGGAGLGLSLVHRLVELHGGSIHLESAPGQGSRFTVSLPWSVGDNLALGERQRSAPPAWAWAAAPHVLVADDHEPTLDLYRDLLGQQGCAVAVARTGAEALAEARHQRPDVIVLDIQMPGIDGLEAIRLIRSDADIAATPIIALTALAMPGDRERCLAAGADAYLAKPVGTRALIAAIAAALPPAR